MNQELIEKTKNLGLPFFKEAKEYIEYPMDSDKLIEYINRLKEKYSLETIPICSSGGRVYFRVSIPLTEEEIQQSINQVQKDAQWRLDGAKRQLEIINSGENNNG